jgi:hypothetical protein
MEQDRRLDSRISFNGKVRITAQDNSFQAEADAKDISLKGIYLVSREKLPIESMCTLDITLTGESIIMRLTIFGRVCRHDDRGMGIAFLDMEEDTFLHIKTLLHLHDKMGVPKKSPAFPCQEG